MKKEYVVTEISAAPDGAPYVIISLTDPRDLKGASQPRFGPQVVGFGSVEDLVKNIQKAFTFGQMAGSTTNLKLDIREYEDSGLKVGDGVYVEITKVEKEGV